ncbi:hypothetical protein HMSSN036_19780 [Paenibacillus macerans]|nr:hypothetical protein HMSSN036_19780 [Paenibacillus macerans]
MKWFQALELFLLPDGISALRLSKVIRVTYKTAWSMLQKYVMPWGSTMPGNCSPET